MNVTNSKILVFIPAYRCEPQIVRVLEQFSPAIQLMVDTVMVVDNQSPDQTLEVAIGAGKSVFTRCNFIAWRNDDNYGLGGSHKAAIRYAIKNGFTHVIVLHGDDQADINDIVPCLASGAHLSTDCLLGARFAKGSQLKGYSRFRTFGNRVYNTLFSIVVMQPVKDLGSGLNMYRLQAFESFYYKTFPDDLTFNYLMLLGSYNRRQTISYFPISWREEDQVSNVRIFRQAIRVLYLLAGYALGRDRFLAKDTRTKPFDRYTGTIMYQQGEMPGMKVSQ